MSMLKKMKDRITDEVTSATNRLQNMQIIDQLTNNIGNQILNNDNTRSTTNSNIMPSLPLPELIDDSVESSRYISSIDKADRPQTRLVDLSLDETTTGCNDDDNSVSSPQHQLFDGRSIKHSVQLDSEKAIVKVDESAPVINISELQSESDDEINILPNNRGDIPDAKDSPQTNQYKTRYKNLVRAVRKYDRDIRGEQDKLVKNSQSLQSQVDDLKNELSKLRLTAINRDISTLSASSSHSECIDGLVNQDGRSSPQLSVSSSSGAKQIRKIKDLEKLMARCKDSLKAKNTQLQILKGSLAKVENFKEFMNEVKNDLDDLKKSHDIWTVKMAEHKRIMHQDIEDKISEIERYKSESNDSHLQIKDLNNTVNHLKLNIQNLENRLVSTSLAHQKERESLTKEMIAARNSALKQQQRNHELSTERIKLDLEKSIEALKSDLLSKDEIIIKNARQNQELVSQNQRQKEDLEEAHRELAKLKLVNENLESRHRDQATELDQLREQIEISQQLDQSETAQEKIKQLELDLSNYQTKYEDCEKENIRLRNQTENHRQELLNFLERLKDIKADIDKFSQVDMESLRSQVCRLQSEKANQKTIEQLELRLSDMSHRLKESADISLKLEDELAKIRASRPEQCQECISLMEKSSKAFEQYEQTIHELNGQLNLMTTANNDQERAIKELEQNNDNALSRLRALKTELEENVKKNESLLQVIQDNEVEMQQQQKQSITDQQNIERYKNELSAMTELLSQNKKELCDRDAELSKLKDENNNIQSQLNDMTESIKEKIKTIESLNLEREKIYQDLSRDSAQHLEFNKQIVVSILACIKSFESPDVSPGSDKNLNNNQKEHHDEQDESGDWSQDEHVESATSVDSSDALRLAKELSTLAVNKSNEYITASQKLQAVLMDNTLINEELRRLKEEMSSLNHEKSLEIKSNLDETERLRTENQALIHDQKAYDDQIAAFESEIDILNRQIDEVRVAKEKLEQELASKPHVETKDVGVETNEDDEVDDLSARYDELDDLLRTREEEIKALRSRLSELESTRHEVVQVAEVPLKENKDSDVPDSMEFEYLKNIVYQFMMGKEPITLARVISAVFKFDKNQVDQICKIQEAIHQISG